MFDKTKCHAEVWPQGAWRADHCSRRAVLEEDGHGWCRQHAPSSVAARKADRHEMWAKRSAGWDWEAREKLLAREVVAAAMAWHMGNSDELFDALSAACEALRLHRNPPKVQP